MKKNILIIDDSALMRRVMSDIISNDDRFTVSDIAINGLEALELMNKNPRKYDALLLDINMPKMNGLELLEQMKQSRISTRVIIVSTVAKQGAKETIRALELGAFDFVTKPDSFIDATGDGFRDSIISCLLAATKMDSVTQTIVNKPTMKQPEKIVFEKKVYRPVKNATKLVAIACSTGGPRALQSVIPMLSGKLDAAVLIVQHMPEGFTNSLAMRLNELSKLEVKEAEDGDIPRKGVVYIAKGGSQMKLVQDKSGLFKLSVQKEEPRNGLRPCADIMYESLVSSNYDEITCVVLTGMGGDGTQGIKKLSEQKNTYVIAQNNETSTVYGMPKVIFESGLVDEVLPLNDIFAAIIKNVGVQEHGC